MTRQARVPRHIKHLDVDRHIQIACTVHTICCSPLVDEYVIGYTSRQGLLRAEEHRRLGFEHFVILADRLTRDEALWLEETLQGSIAHNKDMEIYTKYRADKRNALYRRSAGSRPAPTDDLVHAVYMAWTETEV